MSHHLISHPPYLSSWFKIKGARERVIKENTHKPLDLKHARWSPRTITVWHSRIYLISHSASVASQIHCATCTSTWTHAGSTHSHHSPLSLLCVCSTFLTHPGNLFISPSLLNLSSSANSKGNWILTSAVLLKAYTGHLVLYIRNVRGSHERQILKKLFKMKVGQDIMGQAPGMLHFIFI